MKIVGVFNFSLCKYNQLFCWHHLQFCIKIFIDVFLPLTCSEMYICMYLCMYRVKWNCTQGLHKCGSLFWESQIHCMSWVFRYISMSDMQIIKWSNNGHILVTVRYVVFNHCCTLSPSGAESLWCWKHTLCFTASDTFQATIVAQFPENYTFINGQCVNL
jgi:hypothetical protein